MSKSNTLYFAQFFYVTAQVIIIAVFLMVKKINTKVFSFLNQCLAQLRFWKSVSDSQNLLAGATAVLLETLFQNRSCAKH